VRDREVELEIGGANDEALLAGSLLGRKLPAPSATQTIFRGGRHG